MNSIKPLNTFIMLNDLQKAFPGKRTTLQVSIHDKQTSDCNDDQKVHEFIYTYENPEKGFHCQSKCTMNLSVEGFEKTSVFGLKLHRGAHIFALEVLKELVQNELEKLQ